MLDEQQEVALAALLAGSTHAEAGVACGRHRVTVTRWANYDARFIAEYNQRRLALQTARIHGPTLDSRVRVVFNPSLKAVNAMIPGLIAAILMISILASIMPARSDDPPP